MAGYWDLTDAPYFLTYLQNFAAALRPLRFPMWMQHTWTLAVEEQFYLCWPIIVFFVPQRALVAVCLVPLFGAPVYRALAFAAGGSDALVHRSLPANLDPLAAGCLLAIAGRIWDSRAIGRRRGRSPGLGFSPSLHPGGRQSPIASSLRCSGFLISSPG